MSSLRDIGRLFLASLGTIALVATLNFAVDPLQLLRPATWYRALYSPDSRLQDAGLIRSQQYDTVLMGSSLAVHFRQSDIDRKLGTHSLKLAAIGSNSAEQSFIIEAALQKRPKRVLWQLDEWIFRDGANLESDRHFPAELYRMTAKGIAGYLLDTDTARESLGILLRFAPSLASFVRFLNEARYLKFHVEDVDDINVMPSYEDVSKFYNARNALASYASLTADPTRLSIGSLDELTRNFERDAIALVKRHPDVQFDIWFPPYSILLFVGARDASPQALQVAYDFSSYMTARLLALHNARVFDFRAIAEITHNLENYLDVMHHSPSIDLKVIDMIATDENRVFRSDPDAKLSELKRQVQAYHMDERGLPGAK